VVRKPLSLLQTFISLFLEGKMQHAEMISIKSVFEQLKMRIAETGFVHKGMKQLKSKTASAKKSMLKRKFK